MAAEIEEAVARIRRWGELQDWRGWDPYDALNSPLAPALTLGTAAGRRLLTQAVKLSPVNLRPALGIPRGHDAKALAFVGSAYLRLWQATGDPAAREAAERWLRWLAENPSPGGGWGYHFDVQTRFFRYARGTPNTIATSFVAHAFLEAAELVPGDGWDDAAGEAARFLVERMLDDTGRRPFFRYLPGADELIHNANLLACGVLARTGDESLREVAAHALRTSLDAQRADGAWPYAAGSGRDWVDSFHTGYILESLVHCEGLCPAVAEALERGLSFWARRLFLDDGTPRYSERTTGPLDAHTCAQAIETWLAAAGRSADAVVRVHELASLLVTKLLDPTGYVYLTRGGLRTNRVPLVRWTTAPAFRALAGVLLAERSSVPA